MPTFPKPYPKKGYGEERQKGGDALGGQQTVATSSGRLISSHCQTAVHESSHGARRTFPKIATEPSARRFCLAEKLEKRLHFLGKEKDHSGRR